MFKNKSPLGKENFINEWYIKEPIKGGISPNKTSPLHAEPSFSKVRKHKNNNPERYPQPALRQPSQQISDPLDLECN